MGSQSSIMFCYDKRDMYRLCNLLNKAAVDEKNGLEENWLGIFAVGKLKKAVSTIDLWGMGHERLIGPEVYYVWWGGERAPQRDDNYLRSRARRGYDWIPYWDTVFIEYLPWEDLLAGIVEDFSKGTPEKIHENDWMRVFFPEDDNLISMDLIEQL